MTSPSRNQPNEDLWLEHVARQVETTARPLFIATWIWLLQQALEHDENEQAG